MDKYEIELHHIMFAIASVLISIVFTVLITPETLGTTVLISFIVYVLVLLFLVKVLSILISAGIFNVLKRIFNIFHREIPHAKKFLGSGDIILNATIIITGSIVLESYEILIRFYPIIVTDYLYKLATIFIATIILFPITYFVTKHIGPKDI